MKVNEFINTLETSKMKVFIWDTCSNYLGEWEIDVENNIDSLSHFNLWVGSNREVYTWSVNRKKIEIVVR